MLQISIVVPLYNEAESLPELCSWIDRVMQENQFSYEMIFVNDGSKDDSWQVLQNLSKQYTTIKGISFARNYGKSAALHEGFQKASGQVVITMDADLQDSPDEIPELYRMITSDGYDLVSGWKQKRFDPLTKTIPTKLYNAATRALSGVYLNDFNCGLKAYKLEVVKTIKLYGEMHRYIPVQAKWNGFTKIGEKVVQHQARKYGVTKFGLERFLYGFLDLLSITFVQTFGKRPMHLFGSLGILSFFSGTLITLWLIGVKLYNIANNFKYRNVTDNPLFFLALVAIILGVQLFVAGFLGELLITNSDKTTQYQIKEEIA
ncbi:glycosyltransferase family 2 protein [Aquirufa regiilacus]|jgi:glycosyltransferase involved in cell wall biosynthesis|uniref:Glycosyltransferase family 2 protein n=1 Tax=Aquirufa regiilacus TaxID=3024868 RepID=A0ABU3TUN7_9BACT|nr:MULTISPECIES: glycosyltransferase family 2 protein [unclassified Aquirufa]MDT8888297.1 glycosyltransferase family 2 protein [Aquirufa sp. LEPPI-3A]MDU0809591.1 glycosyltransferase family 2 protein [Aquirufa sp. LEOWEIH-7C]